MGAWDGRIEVIGYYRVLNRKYYKIINKEMSPRFCHMHTHPIIAQVYINC